MRGLRILAVCVGGVFGAVALLFAALQTGPGQRALASVISAAASSPGSRLELSGLDGFFPTDLRLARLELSDGQGPWLRVEEARLRWSFASLFTGRLMVETLAASRVALLRTPTDGEVGKSSSTSSRFDLPVGIDLQALSIDDLHLAAPLAGIDSRWKAGGSALIAADGTESRLRLALDRTDGPWGHGTADIRFDLSRRTVDGEMVFDEERGGVVAALLERPDLDRVSMRLAARGDAATGSTDLTVSAGDAATAKGTARWQPDGPATAVSVHLDVAAPGLPDGRFARLAREPIVLTAEASVADTLVTLREARLTAGPNRVHASGRYDRVGDKLDGTVRVESDEQGPLDAQLGGMTWRGLRLQAHGELGDLAKQPQGTVTLTGSADDFAYTGLEGRVPAAGRTELVARLGLQRDGRLVVESLDVTSSLATMKGSGSYLPSTEIGEGKATVELPSLEPLSALAGRPLVGSGRVELSARSGADGVTLGWQGAVQGLTVPELPVDLVTSTVALSGGATLKRDESWILEAVRVASEGATLEVAGRGHAQTGTFDLSLALPKLGVLAADVAGAAKVSATIGLRDDGTDLRVTAELSDLARQALTSRSLSVVVAGSLTGEAARGTIEANGDLVGQPLTLSGRFDRDAQGGLTVPTFDGSWASATLAVANLAVTPSRTTGNARLRMTRLQDLAALVDVGLAGAVDLEVATEPQSPTGKVQVRLRGEGLRSGGIAVGTLGVDAAVEDPFGAATTDATVAAGRIAGLADIGRLDGTVKGGRQGGLDIALRASGARTNANLAAKVELAAEEIRIALSRFEGRHEGIPLSLAAPTRLRIAGARVKIDPMTLRLGGGRVAMQGVLDPAVSDLAVEIAALPLSLIDSFAPGSGLEGTLQARLRLGGAMADPRIDATYQASGLRLRRPDAALLPSLALQGSASVIARQATVDARLSAGGSTSLALKGKARLPQGRAPLSATLAVTGSIDVAPFAPMLGNNIRNVAGTLRPDFTLSIEGARVTGTGTVALANAALSLPESGLRLSGGEGLLALQGEVLQVQRLAFKTAGNGGLTVSGSVRLDPAQGFPVDLAVASRRALLVNRTDLIATVSSDLKVTGSTGAGFDVAGPITIDRAEIAIGGLQTANFPTLEVREINRPGQADPPPQAPSPRGPPRATPVRLALAVQAPQAVFVRGRGLDAEVGGQLQVTGDPAAPSVIGNLALRRGDFTLVGRRLVFSRGNVSLDNLDAIDPRLDFLATTSSGSTSFQVAITGTSRKPRIELTSVPALPPDEAMAQLLFGKASSSLSAFELVQAAQALAELTGGPAPGSGVLGRLRKGLGLDKLSVGSGSGSGSGSRSGQGTGPVSLEGGRYVSPGVYVGARQGAGGDSSRGVVEIQVLENTRIEGDIGANSTGRIGAKMEWDY